MGLKALQAFHGEISGKRISNSVENHVVGNEAEGEFSEKLRNAISQSDFTERIVASHLEFMAMNHIWKLVGIVIESFDSFWCVQSSAICQENVLDSESKQRKATGAVNFPIETVKDANDRQFIFAKHCQTKQKNERKSP